MHSTRPFDLQRGQGNYCVHYHLVRPSTQKTPLYGKCNTPFLIWQDPEAPEPLWTRTMQVHGDSSSKRQSLHGGGWINMLARHVSMPQALYLQKITVQLLVSLSRVLAFSI